MSKLIDLGPAKSTLKETKLIDLGPASMARPETIISEPVNWADQIIARYQEEQHRTDLAQTARSNLEYKLDQQRRNKLRMASFGGVSPYHLPSESAMRKVKKVGETVTPEVRREALRTGMGYAGGLHPKHPMLLAGLGGATAEAIYQLGQHAIGSPKAPETPGKALKRIGVSGGIEFGEEGAARGLMRVLSPGAKVPKARRETVEWMRKRGIQPTLAQATESRGGVGILESIAEGSFTGGPGMRLHKANVESQLQVLGDDMVKAFGGMSDAEAGRMFVELLLSKKAGRQAITKPMYEEMARMSKGHLIKSAPLRRKFAKLLQEISLKDVMPSLENKQLKRIFMEGAVLPDEIPFEVVQKIRRQIGEIAFAHPMEKTGRLFTEQTERQLQEVYFDIGKIYKDTKYGLPPEAAALLKRADFITSDTHNIWDKKLIQKLVKDNPEKVINSIIKKGAVTNVDEALATTQLFKTLPAEGKEILRGAFVKDLITDKAIRKTADGNMVLDGAKLLDYLDRGVGEEVISKFMSPKEITELKYFGDALRVYAAKPAAMGGGITIKILQAGAILELGHLAIPGAKGKTEAGFGTAGTILLGPKAISYLFTNPAFVKILSNALISEGGPKAATRILTRVLANKMLKKFMAEDKRDMAKAKEQRFKEIKEELIQKYQHRPL